MENCEDGDDDNNNDVFFFIFGRNCKESVSKDYDTLYDQSLLHQF